MQKKDLIELGVRDKFLSKFFLVGTSLLCVLCVVLLVFWNNLSGLKRFLVIACLIIDLLLATFSLCLLLSPRVAIDGSKEGVYLHGLFKSEFYSFAEIQHASSKSTNSRYARNDNPVAFAHNERNDIGTVYIVVTQENGSRTRLLFRIVNATFVAHWINDEKKKLEKPSPIGD